MFLTTGGLEPSNRNETRAPIPASMKRDYYNGSEDRRVKARQHKYEAVR